MCVCNHKKKNSSDSDVSEYMFNHVSLPLIILIFKYSNAQTFLQTYYERVLIQGEFRMQIWLNV